MNRIVAVSILALALFTQASSEDVPFDDSSWNTAFILRVSGDNMIYLVGGAPYTGTLVQNDDEFFESITVRAGIAVRDSSVYFTDRESGERYCTEVESTSDTLVTDVITYADASYADERNPATGAGHSIYTENGKICMTAVYDSLSYHEYGKCVKQDWFDELLE